MIELSLSAVALLTSVCTLIIAAAGARAAWRGEKAAKINTAAIQEIHISINSRMDQLLKITASSSRAAGAKDEKDHPTA